MNAAAKYGAALTSPNNQAPLLLLLPAVVSRPKTFGQSRLAPFDPVWSHPLKDVPISNPLSLAKIWSKLTVLQHRQSK